MKNLKQFVIQFESLKNGSHNFHFEIDQAFFEELGSDEISKGKFQVDIDFEKLSTMLVLNFKIKGSVLLSCDRCLEDFNYNLKSNHKLYVKFGEESHEESDEVYILASNKGEIDVSQFIFEYIILAVTQRKVHDEKDCDPEILKLLNENQKAQPKIEESDPRWDVLKNLN
jgi:uncharacterized metal-binding protein YceD (DUF177 family)